MRRIVVALGIVVLAVLLGTRLGNGPAPGREPRTMRELTAEQLLGRVERREEPLRLRAAADVLPGGYAAAMIPVVVDWNDDGGRPGYVTCYNVNHGGNPIEGTTVLRTARVPLEGVAAVEFTLLPLDHIGREGLVQHGQLRIVFDADHPVVFTGLGGPEMGSDPAVHDLVISWEAWRPPDVGYDVLTGMDPSAYLLTPRVFSGPQRFLEDGLGERPWISYELDLPGGREGRDELVKVALALCDGVARRAIGIILRQGIEEWARQAPGGTPDGTSGWEELRGFLPAQLADDDPLLALSGGDATYQSLLRSCATMAHYTVDVTAARLIALGHTGGMDLDHWSTPHLGEQEPWMTELATTGVRGVFLRSPAAVRYLRRHPGAFPKNIPGELERAGLLLRRDGAVVKHRYALKDRTPYGTLADNLIR